MATKKIETTEKVDLEKNISYLDKLVNKLQNDKLSIDKSLEIYDEAIKLAKVCLDQINESKGKLELLKNEKEKMELDLDNER